MLRQGGTGLSMDSTTPRFTARAVAGQAPGLLVWLLTLAAVLTLLETPGMHEMATWISWMDLANQVDPVYAYHNDPNAYPPGAVTTLLIASRLFPFDDPAATVKMLLLMVTMATSVVTGLWLRSWPAAWVTLGFFGVSAVGLAHLDVLFALPLTLGLWCLQRQYWASTSFLLSSSSLLKWQPLILAPVFAIHVVKQVLLLHGARSRIVMAIRVLLPAAIVYALALRVFGASYMLEASGGATQQDLLSGNALNLAWILGSLVTHAPDQMLTHGYVYVSDAASWMAPLCRVIFFASFGLVIFLAVKGRPRFEEFLVAGQLSVLAYSLFAVGVHQNHLTLAVPVSLGIIWLVPQLRISAIVVIVMAVLNLVVFYGLAGTPFRSPFTSPVDFSVILAGLYLVAGISVLWSGARFLWSGRTLAAD